MTGLRPPLRRIWALLYRHLALYRRSWPRLLELAYWPTLQLCIWGFTATFFAARLGNPGAVAFGVLLGGVLLWEIALRSQMGVAIGFLEEIWSRNLGHVFVSPLRPWELMAALIGDVGHAGRDRRRCRRCCWRGCSMRSTCSRWGRCWCCSPST